jgi:hypothetical protein
MTTYIIPQFKNLKLDNVFCSIVLKCNNLSNWIFVVFYFVISFLILRDLVFPYPGMTTGLILPRLEYIKLIVRLTIPKI